MATWAELEVLDVDPSGIMAVSLRLCGREGTSCAVKPLNELILEAIEIAKRQEPGLTEPAIAERAGLAKSHLSRAKKHCGAVTLAAVFDSMGLDLAVVHATPKKSRKALR